MAGADQVEVFDVVFCDVVRAAFVYSRRSVTRPSASTMVVVAVPPDGGTTVVRSPS
ncbi:hypothetical protein ACIBO4_33730 [Streptomyces sp. NPDC050149]|uniref:hypothetical protein n=1 Tax=Streptomyces sp. NPDC050149 TaxID=3365603 RepID=UPI0037B3ED09